MNFYRSQNEVEKVAESKRQMEEPTETPWRKVSQCEHKKLKTEIESYVPLEGVKVGRVNILMVGSVGAGKSSYFNTINSIFRGHVTSQACSGSAEKSLTTKYRKYKIRSSSTGTPLKFCLCDTRGLEKENGLDPSDVVALLNGNVPDKYTFNPASGITDDAPGYKKSPSLSDQMHCVAVVVDGCSVDVFPDSVLTYIKSIQEKAVQKGIPQVVILSKVDKACPLTAADPANMFVSPTVGDLVDKVSQLVGLPRSHVLPVKNYEKEIDLVESVDLPALISVRQMLRFADDYLYNFLDDVEK